MAHDFDVIVVGGGLAGLAAGATASKAGLATVVLEAHDPGGRARTTQRDGFAFNMGGHALYAGGVGMEVLGSLGVTPAGAAPPLDRYKALSGGRQHALPMGPASLLRTTVVGRRSKAQLGRLLGLLGRLRPDTLAGESVSGWLADQGLRPDAELVVRALVRLSTYSSDLDHLGADAAAGQLQLGAKKGVRYLHGGWGQLVDALQAQVQVRTRCEVKSIEPVAGGVEVHTSTGRLVAGAVVLAPGGPEAAARLFRGGAAWSDLGEPVTAACLDVGVRRVPSPGYVLGLDEPLYGTTQSPPARQSPDGQAMVAVIRYGARSAAEDRPQLEAHLRETGVGEDDVVREQFLARMVVTGAMPRAETGGLRGRPTVTSTGARRVYVAGDWVGPVGLLADASLASGRDAALAAVRDVERSRTAAVAG